MNNNELDMFKVLGITPAASTEKTRNKSEYVQKLAAGKAQFLKIVFRESEVLNLKKESEADKYLITLPYNHDKSISDSLSARISNT